MIKNITLFFKFMMIYIFFSKSLLGTLSGYL